MYQITELDTPHILAKSACARLPSTEEITLFDGAGVVCQDLAVATVSVELALKTGDAIEIES